ncbi:serine hydrolase domain-containing protein [Amycolatopsis thermophila]|uniref:CubicO group peptidase (Beta-lactamase class C family) n=1 Tax=Amycolatopsis thermophila TaxID=206084 RepID=A0ABU0F6H6_9PSEU|nr:serine hydrolase domain-containing protein [Amycolatopsis thermophila]MDQ0382988.1 CubicO group peptidase (beta-lactamase class C family) [Amycolatopsis thermophila]
MTLHHRVQDVADELVATGAETGLQVVVHHRGRRVVDVVAGVADGTTGRPVTPEILFFSFSTGKGVAALIAHLLVSNGLVGYDTPVAEVWPEFGVHGKATATLRQVLTHTVGVPAMPGVLGPTDLADWPRVCAAIAAAEPRWRPGTVAPRRAELHREDIADRVSARSMSHLVLKDHTRQVVARDIEALNLPAGEHVAQRPLSRKWGKFGQLK